MKKICYIVTISRTIKSFFCEQINYLSENGFDISVICHDNIDIKKYLHNNIKLYEVNIPRGINPVKVLKSYFKIKSIIKAEKFDLVQYSTPVAAFISSLAAKICKIPVRNYHIMGYRFEGSKGLSRKILFHLEKTACKNSTHIECVCNATLKKGIELNLFPKEKAVVIGSGSTGGVNTDKFDINKKTLWRKEIREKYNISDDTLIYGFLGRICRDKGINELVSAFNILSKENHNIKLMLVGNMEDKNFWSLSEDKNIIMTGNVNNPESYISAFDVLVLPSYREGFGNVLIEAETMGVTCIASDIDGPRDAMKNNETGFLVPVKDINVLAKAMKDILLDENYNKFSKNAIHYAKLFDSKVVCENILNRKEALLANRCEIEK